MRERLSQLNDTPWLVLFMDFFQFSRTGLPHVKRKSVKGSINEPNQYKYLMNCTPPQTTLN